MTVDPIKEGLADNRVVANLQLTMCSLGLPVHLVVMSLLLEWRIAISTLGNGVNSTLGS